MHNEVVGYLLNLDVEGMRRFHAASMPHVSAGTDAEILATMHMARTQSEAIPADKRAYSHRWLTERGLPSQLPDRMRRSAEQVVPRVAKAVGIGVKFRQGELAPAAVLIRGAMEDVVQNAFADGKTDTAYVRPRMNEAMMKERRKLFGELGTSMSGKLALADKAAAADPSGKVSASAFADAQMAKLNVAALDVALKAKAKDSSALEFRAGNALNSARDVGYSAALMDVFACRPDAAGFGSAQDALDAWASLIGGLLPQAPP